MKDLRNSEDIYVGFMEAYKFGESLVSYNMYIDNSPITQVIITFKKDKFYSIEWYLNNRHYTKYDLNAVPKKYQTMFNKLLEVALLRESQLDYFII